MILNIFPALLFYDYEREFFFAENIPDVVQTSILIIVKFELLKTVR